MSRTPSLDQLRASAREHAKQLDAVSWVSVNDLAARWGVSPGTVRKIPRALLPYLTLGESQVRRYDPRDIESYEEKCKRGDAA